MSKRMIVRILCIFVILGACTLTVQAKVLGFTTQTPSDTKKNDIISSLGLEQIGNDSYNGGICGFDVNEDGSYALAFGSGSNCTVQVYDPDGMFLYGFKFRSDGDYSIGFHGDALAIFLLRSNLILLYDANGMCIDVQEVISSPSNLLHARELLNRTCENVDGRKYMLEQDTDLGDTYSRFVIVHENGEKTVLYDYSANHAVGQVIALAFGTGFFMFVIWGIINKCKNATV